MEDGCHKNGQMSDFVEIGHSRGVENRWTQRRTDRDMNRQKNRWTDRQTETQTD